LVGVPVLSKATWVVVAAASITAPSVINSPRGAPDDSAEVIDAGTEITNAQEQPISSSASARSTRWVKSRRGPASVLNHSWASASAHALWVNVFGLFDADEEIAGTSHERQHSKAHPEGSSRSCRADTL
jgi:hypothetical protein